LFPNLVGYGLQALEGERVVIVTGISGWWALSSEFYP
jgi:hypothetical protein